MRDTCARYETPGVDVTPSGAPSVRRPSRGGGGLGHLMAVPHLAQQVDEARIKLLFRLGSLRAVQRHAVPLVVLAPLANGTITNPDRKGTHQHADTGGSEDFARR